MEGAGIIDKRYNLMLAMLKQDAYSMAGIYKIVVSKQQGKYNVLLQTILTKTPKMQIATI